MLRPILSAWFLLFTGTLYSQDYLDIKLTPALFSQKEIVDSLFREIAVVIEYQDWRKKIIRMDTVYQLHYSEDGFLIFEKKKLPSSSSESHYAYDTSGNLTIHNQTIFNPRDSQNRVSKHFYKKGKESEIQYYNDGKLTDIGKKSYDLRGRLTKTDFRNPNGSNISWLYYFNDKDSLIREVFIEWYDHKVDSILTTYQYDEFGNIVEKNMRPSPTYSKTIGIVCGNGLYEYFRRKYDSLGRVIFETGYSEKELEIYGYDNYSYIKYFYSENGFICKKYNSKHQETVIAVYTRFAEKYFNEGVLAESYNTESKLTRYLSEESMLPRSIDYRGKYTSQSIKYLFYYKK